MNQAGSVEKPPHIDGNKLRKENWTLGGNSFKYESVNQTAFISPRQTNDSEARKEELKGIKDRVRGVNVTYKAGSQDEMTLKSYFQTNSQINHRPFTGAGPVDASQAEEARKKLSASNFHVGDSPVKYQSHTQKTHPALVGVENLSIFDRKKIALRNNITNFIDTETRAFEKQSQSARYGMIPVKDANNDSQVSHIMADLKATHFDIGKAHQDNFGHRTNRVYGANQPTNQRNAALPWATRATNFNMGSLATKTVSDYRDRFNITEKKPTTRKQDGDNNKLKLQSSAIQLQSNNLFSARVASQD